MSESVRFLIGLSQALAAMRFYHESHPARSRAIHSAFESARDLLDHDARPRFTFIEGEAIYDRLLLRELGDWDWAARFENVGIQRLEFDVGLTIEDFERFLYDVAARLAGDDAWLNVGRQLAASTIRYGALEVRDEPEELEPIALTSPDTALSLAEEIEAIRWIHEEVKGQRSVPLLEADFVVRSLTLAIHREGHVVLPLLRLREFDQYTTTHSCNVAVLATAFAEHLGLAPEHARAMGVSGLLHDIGKVRIPRDVLVKPGRLDARERRIIEQHPVEGARILIERERDLDLAAIVSFEHHRWTDGRGYPARRRPRDTHRASRIVQVCDVFDALCTDRPYRGGLKPEVALAQIEAESGTHFEPGLVHAFAEMVRASMLEFAPIDSHPANASTNQVVEPA